MRRRDPSCRGGAGGVGRFGKFAIPGGVQDSRQLPESKIGCHEHPHQVFWPWKILDKFQIPNQQPAKMQQSIENHPKKTHINNKNYVACWSPPKTRACHPPDFFSEIKERLGNPSLHKGDFFAGQNPGKILEIYPPSPIRTHPHLASASHWVDQGSLRFTLPQLWELWINL